MANFRTFLILLILILAMFFSPIFFTGNDIAGNYGDVYLHYYPLKYLVSEHVVSGSLPLWNPYIFAGQPLLANPQSAVFYPLSLLFYFLPLPIAFNYFTILHFFLGGLFMYLFLSQLNLGRSAAFMGSITLVLSSFLVYKVPSGHPVALSGYIWVPLILMAAHHLAVTREIKGILILALGVGFQFLSGHAFPLYISLVAVLLHLFFFRMSYWRELLAGLGFVVFLCGLQLIPSLELSQVSETGNWPQLVASYSMPLKNIINVLLPSFFGNLRSGTYVFQSNPSFFFERHALYFGVLPLILTISGFYAACARRRFLYPFMACAGLLLALGFYTPVYRFLYDTAPFINFLRVPARFYYMTLVACIILAALGWNRYISRREQRIKLLIIVLIIADLFAWGKQFIYAESMTAYRRKSEASSFLNPLHRIVTEPDRLPANKSMLYHHFNVNGYEAVMLDDFTRYLSLQEKGILSTTGLARADLQSPLARGFALGHLITTDISSMGTLVASFPGGTRLYAFSKPLPRIFLARTVKLSDKMDVFEQIQYLKQTKFSPEQELLVPALPPYASWMSGDGTLSSYRCTSGKITAGISLKAPAAVVFSEIFYSGWSAWAKGQRYAVYRGDKVWRTIFLPAGEYIGKDRVVLYYRPFSWIFGLSMTLLAMLALALFALRRSLLK